MMGYGLAALYVLLVVCLFMLVQRSKSRSFWNALMCLVGGVFVLYTVLDSWLDSLKISLAVWLLQEPKEYLLKILQYRVNNHKD